MKDSLLQSVKDFLHLHFQPGKPLLLGFSGGPDSLALLHLLLEARRFFPLEIHVAHIDHSWRKESRSEAERFKLEAEKWGLPFYVRTLQPPENQRNLEDAGRQERFQFFLELYGEKKFQALLLAHQADDQAETVLKRLFEGAHLFSCAGLRPASVFEGMPVWRPLLGIPKKALLQWLEERNLTGIDDASNRDPRFLRARMRVSLFPEMAKQFGKEISSNLNRLGTSLHDLRDYLERKTASYFERGVKTSSGIAFDLNPLYPLEKVELNAFLKKILEQEKIILSHSALQTLQELIINKASHRRILHKNGELIADKGTLTVNNNLN